MAKARDIDDESFICFTKKIGETTNESLGNGAKDINCNLENDEGTSSASQLKMNSELQCDYSLTLNEEDELLYACNGQSNEVGSNYSVASVCSSLAQENKVQIMLDDMFFSMESSEDGCVQVSKLVDHIKRSVDCDQLHSADVFDVLWSMFDPNNENISVDIHKFREVMTMWVNHFQQDATASNSGGKSDCDTSLNLLRQSFSSSPVSSSPIKARPSSFGIIRESVLDNCSFGSLEGFGGDSSQRDHLLMVAELKELEYQNKLLQERIEKLSSQLNSLEEINAAVTEEKQDLKRRLSMYRSSKEKCKELEASVTILKDDNFKIECDNSTLRNMLDDLLKENALLEARIENMKDDTNIVYTDMEQMKLTRESLLQELEHLNSKVQQLENEVELKDTRLIKEQNKWQEIERLMNYWKTKSVKCMAERDRLEMELEQAIRDAEGYKRKCELTQESLNEERKISTPSKDNENVVNSVNNESFLVTTFTPMSLRQELEGLLGKDNQLPTPFCEKLACSPANSEISQLSPMMTNKSRILPISERLGEDGDEGVEDGSDDDVVLHSSDCSLDDNEQLIIFKKQLSFALRLIRSSKTETSSLLSLCQQLSTICVSKYYGSSAIDHAKKENWCQEIKNVKPDGPTSDGYSTANSASATANLNNDLLSQLKGCDANGEESASLFKDERFTFDSPMAVSLVVNELFSLPTDLCTCCELVAVAINNMSWSKSNESRNTNIWGKTAALNQNLAKPDVDNNRDNLLFNYKSSDSFDDIYRRLIEDIKNDNLVRDNFVENHFFKLMETLVERRSSLFQRAQMQNQKKQLAKQAVEKLLYELKFGSLLNNNCEKQIHDLEVAISDLSHDSECVGSVKEEMEMSSIIDKLVQYFDRTYMHLENKFRQDQRAEQVEAAVNSPISNQSNQKCHAEVQCNIDTKLDVEISQPAFNNIQSNNILVSKERSLQTTPSDYISGICRLLHCWKDKCCDAVCNLTCDIHTMGLFAIVGMISIAVFGSVVYFIFNCENSCSSCWRSDSSCAKSWSEILKPMVQLRHPPNAF